MIEVYSPFFETFLQASVLNTASISLF